MKFCVTCDLNTAAALIFDCLAAPCLFKRFNLKPISHFSKKSNEGTSTSTSEHCEKKLGTNREESCMAHMALPTL